MLYLRPQDVCGERRPSESSGPARRLATATTVHDGTQFDKTCGVFKEAREVERKKTVEKDFEATT